MKEVVVIEETWGLGVTQSFKLKVSKEEEEFFKELLDRYKKVVVSDYPKVVKEYRIVNQS